MQTGIINHLINNFHAINCVQLTSNPVTFVLGTYVNSLSYKKIKHNKLIYLWLFNAINVGWLV